MRLAKGTSVQIGRPVGVPDGRTRAKVRTRWLKGWTISQIADDLGISRQAAHQHVKRIREEDGHQ